MPWHPACLASFKASGADVAKFLANDSYRRNSFLESGKFAGNREVAEKCAALITADAEKAKKG